MNAQIIVDGVDLTEHLLSISRSKNYCAISQEFDIDLSFDFSGTINTYAPIVIYEKGTKVLTGFVSRIDKNIPDAVITLSGKDKYKLAEDYFIDEYITTTQNRTTRYWVEYFLNLAGLSATYTSGDGVIIPKGTVYGMDSVASTLQGIMQNAGWYGYLDADGNLFFGKLSKVSSGITIKDKVDILEFKTNLSYDSTRNVAHVHGGTELTLDGVETIFAKAKKNVPFLPTDQTVVAANHLIANQETAQQFANELVETLSKPDFVKEVTVIGNPNLRAGQYIYVEDNLFSGKALVTSLTTSLDESGYTMRLVLDKLCPRIIAHIKGQDELYAGTVSNGVWAYNVYGSVWTDISSGLTDLEIIDLSVDSGLFVTSTPSGVFTKINDNDWVHQSLPAPTASGYVGGGTFTYPAVYANVYDREVNALVSYSGGDGQFAWLYTGKLNNNSFNWESASINDDLISEPVIGYDLEGTSSIKYITVMSGSGTGIANVGNSYISTDLYPVFTFYGDSMDMTPRAPHNTEIETRFADVAEPWTSDWSASPGTSVQLLSDGRHTYAVYVFAEVAGISKYDAATGSLLDSSSTVFQSFVVYCKGYLYGAKANLGPTTSSFEIYRVPVTDLSVVETVYSASYLSSTITTSSNWVNLTVFDGNVYGMYALGGVGLPANYASQIRIVGVNDDAVFLNANIGSEKKVSSKLVLDSSGNLYTQLSTGSYDTESDEFTTVYHMYKYGSGITGTITYVDGSSSAETRWNNYEANGPIYSLSTLVTTGGSAYADLADGTYNILGNKISDYHVIGSSDSNLYATSSAGGLYRLLTDGSIEASTSIGSANDFLFTDTAVLYVDTSLHELDRFSLNEKNSYTLSSYLQNPRYFRMSGNNIYFVDTSYTIYSIRASTIVLEMEGTPQNLLLETSTGEYFTILYSGSGFTETNVDSVLNVYGEEGLWYSDSFFADEPTQPATIVVKDAAGKINNVSEIFYTTNNGIYKTTVSGSNSLQNAVNASEIVARTFDDGEVYFSVGGGVKVSTDDTVTYTDISTGLPGSTITVLRLGESL